MMWVLTAVRFRQVGFIHRDLKPSNIALGHKYSDRNRFFHIFDFGLSREYIIVDADGKTKMRRPRPYVHFRKNSSFLTPVSQLIPLKGNRSLLLCQRSRKRRTREDGRFVVPALYYGRVTRTTSLGSSSVCDIIYTSSDTKYLFRDKQRILKMKRDTELDELLENCPIEMIPFAEHIRYVGDNVAGILT
ncbi:hypothetical protein OESDEN_05644 [Oesophagostomum dentatum]|uniref:Protein kinase domain-containing protein n=1 Tax=Oesophagostomum dentatum TaxID=61180 RepID=A0A0B1TE73_OESDE|nr:hypothetical protein OESDEN_05644 [Oesophagostomum dentatum]